MGKTGISVITLTKNRAPLLALCLQSLIGQLTGDDEIILVNNRSTDTTDDVIRAYVKKLPIRSYSTEKKGFATLYNFALSKMKNPYAVLLDDDCIADKNFVTSVKKAIRKYPNSIIQGMTDSVPKGNLYADIMGMHYQNWITLQKSNGTYMRTFDNKNAVIPKIALDTYGYFSEQFNDGCEDIEFGIRMRKNGITLVFEPSIRASHHERTTFRTFLAQHARIARTEKFIDDALQQASPTGMIPMTKWVLHARGALFLMLSYIITGRLHLALALPFLYIVLFIVRIFNYSLR